MIPTLLKDASGCAVLRMSALVFLNSTQEAEELHAMWFERHSLKEIVFVRFTHCSRLVLRLPDSETV